MTAAWLEQSTQRIETELEASFIHLNEPAKRLQDAMRYAVMGGGKRIRPLLVYAAASLKGQSLEKVPGIDASAVAVELFHTYSLVHDDLPSMDNDDLRRGRATVHKAYDEATALLVGDALQTMAFELVAGSALKDEQKVATMLLLSKAGGLAGMAGGQAIDLESVGASLEQPELERMHRLKTGALLRACVGMGGVAIDLDEVELERLDQYASSLGLAFQVVDDILDATSDSQTLGKTAGKDAAADKPTFVSLMGLDGAQDFARKLHQESIDSLSVWGDNANLLKALANKVLYRQN
ncbi:polyprenyl synthetase family protein [Polynucleobacter sp. MWH-Spelu-300-X4]|uniref:polyprenyl synthetase family protein n=1 Tax=Polynucleobacter sp. MWH-Spelu-300-X4 TaxID=2689109 RepID=UPI001BFDC84C|nr:farnesyl diphosphate synthase [Polynucleobacter sp. MWH-Spelu-300-X4]QWD79465.1 polyprenyl synthetase family protein [Polynucleobacter sp. MWH-Spelu-300-X4]